MHEIFREGWQWASEQLIKFWWWSGSPSGYRDCFPDSSLLGDKWYEPTALNDVAVHDMQPAGIAIATMMLLRHQPMTYNKTDITTLARRALAEVCTDPVLLVSYCNFFIQVSTMRYDVVHYIVCNANGSPFIIVLLACRDGKCLLHCCYQENAKAEFNCGTRISCRGCLATINGHKTL